MKIPKEAVSQFQELYRVKYGKELTFEEAEIEARELLNLYALSQNKNIFYE